MNQWFECWKIHESSKLMWITWLSYRSSKNIFHFFILFLAIILSFCDVIIFLLDLILHCLSAKRNKIHQRKKMILFFLFNNLISKVRIHWLAIDFRDFCKTCVIHFHFIFSLMIKRWIFLDKYIHSVRILN
jgi:hypothetical protein